MKKVTLFSTIIMVLLIFICGITFFSSRKADGLSSVERRREILTGATWQLENVSVDGVDRSSYFTGTTLTFSSYQYRSVNGNPVWPDSGTWSFSDDGLVILRDGMVSIRIISVTAIALELEIDWEDMTGEEGGRRKSPARYRFKFTR